MPIAAWWLSEPPISALLLNSIADTSNTIAELYTSFGNSTPVVVGRLTAILRPSWRSQLAGVKVVKLQVGGSKPQYHLPSASTAESLFLPGLMTRKGFGSVKKAHSVPATRFPCSQQLPPFEGPSRKRGRVVDHINQGVFSSQPSCGDPVVSCHRGCNGVLCNGDAACSFRRNKEPPIARTRTPDCFLHLVLGTRLLHNTA